MLSCFHKCCGTNFQGQGQDKLGIYIKSVVKGGAADKVRELSEFLHILELILLLMWVELLVSFRDAKTNGIS